MAKTIAIGIPTTEFLYAAFFEGWLQLELPPPSIVPRKVVKNLPLHQAHNALAEWFLKETEANYLLLIEHDHLLPANLLERVANYEEPVVGALYYLRYPPHMPCCFVPNPKHPETGKNYWQDEDVWNGKDWSNGKVTALFPSLEEAFVKDGGLQRVCVVGMGCTAIRRDVLANWKEKPYFQPFQRDGSETTDDVRFCQEAARQGHGVYLDSGLVISHLAVNEVTRDTYRAELKRKARKLGLVA